MYKKSDLPVHITYSAFGRYKCKILFRVQHYIHTDRDLQKVIEAKDKWIFEKIYSKLKGIKGVLRFNFRQIR